MGTVAHKAYVKSVVASIWDRTCEGNSCQLQNTPAVNTGMAPPLTTATSVHIWGNGLKVVWYSTLLLSGSLCRQATLLASPAVGGALRALQRTAVEQTCGTD